MQTYVGFLIEKKEKPASLSTQRQWNGGCEHNTNLNSKSIYILFIKCVVMVKFLFSLSSLQFKLCKSGWQALVLSFWD